MRPRSCHVHLWISNDKGEKACYSLKPLPSAELGQSVAGFFLTKLSGEQPVYAVTVEVGGMVSCNCPQHGIAGACKHCDAMLAAGVLPSALLGLLQERTMLLNEAERSLKLVTERALQLQQAFAAIGPAKPKSRRQRVAEARAA